MDPIREYVWIAVALGLAAFAVWIGHKIELDGENKVLVVQQQAALAEQQHVEQVQHAADIRYAALQDQLAAALAAPPRAGAPVLLCRSTPAAPVQVPGANGSAGSASNGAGGPGVGVAAEGAAVDIAPATESILQRLKAKLDYLQGYVESCQAAGLCATK